jgi:hypothetical protein
MRENGAPEFDAAAAGTGCDLSPEQCHHIRFVLELVDRLATRHGFDPVALTDPRTGSSLAPVLARMRQALAASDAERPRPNGQ